MKYTGNTVSKPVTGKSAERLAIAVKSGTYVSNVAAQETIQQILDSKRQQTKQDATKTRFEGVSFEDIPVVEMNPAIVNLCRGFKCKRPEFQSYIGGNLIKTESESILSKCFIVHHGLRDLASRENLS